MFDLTLTYSEQDALIATPSKFRGISAQVSNIRIRGQLICGSSVIVSSMCRGALADTWTYKTERLVPKAPKLIEHV